MKPAGSAIQAALPTAVLLTNNKQAASTVNVESGSNRDCHSNPAIGCKQAQRAGFFGL